LIDEVSSAGEGERRGGKSGFVESRESRFGERKRGKRGERRSRRRDRESRKKLLLCLTKVLLGMTLYNHPLIDIFPRRAIKCTKKAPILVG
jgi:hypothetical protein